MSENREALVRLLDQLEAAPPATGLIARLRQRWELHQGHSILEWDENRAEGQRAILTGPLSTGLALVCAAPVLFALPRWLGHLSVGAIALRLALCGAMALLGILVQARRLWAASEKIYAQWVQRARQLPPASPPGSDPR